MRQFVTITLFLICFSIGASAQIKSRYSATSGKACKETLRSAGDHGAVRTLTECAGVAKYKLEFPYYPSANGINIVWPDDQKAGALLPIPDKAMLRKTPESKGVMIEWRIRKKIPFAMIVPAYVAIDNSPDSKKIFKKYVYRLDLSKVCVTKIVAPSRKMTSIARKAADNSAKAPCIELK